MVKAVPCTAIKPDGKPCSFKSHDGSGFCGHHKNWSGAVATPGAVAAHAQTVHGVAAVADLDPMANPMDPDVGDTLDGDAPALPIPSGIVAGDPIGAGACIGGQDLHHSYAQFIRYQDPADPTLSREVLHAVVTEEGEAKLRDALGLGETTITQAVEVEVSKHGRHPIDEQHLLHEKVTALAKGINTRLKSGDEDHRVDKNKQRLDEFEAAFEAALTNSDPDDPAQAAMFAAYENHLNTFAKVMAPGWTPTGDYQLDKLPMMGPWEGGYTTMETTYQQVLNPNLDLTDALLPTSEVPNGRIGASYNMQTCTSSWDGNTVHQTAGKQWKVDLGDGYSAYYTPRELIGASDAWSTRGRLAVCAPAATASDPAGLASRLEKMNLTSAQMTRRQAEHAYLESNARSLGVLDNHAVHHARETGRLLEEAKAQELAIAYMGEHQSKVAAMSESEQVALARQLQVQAAAESLPERVEVLRDAVAKSTGYADGTALRSDPSYDPTPKPSKGTMTWDRFNPTPGKDGLATSAGFTHNFTNSDDQTVRSVIRSGLLASQEQRRRMGINSNLGMSESADVKSGGGGAVFTSWKHEAPSSSGVTMVWSGTQARSALRRTDWYATKGDHFGAVNPNDPHYKTGYTRRVDTANSYSGGQLMFEDGIDLHATPPSKILCSSSAKRKVVLDAFADAGVTHLGGRPVAQIVT